MGRLKTDTWEQMLEQMEQEGVGFYLNGKKTAPREIIRTCCMREKAVYMPDFVMDVLISVWKSVEKGTPFP